MVLRVHGPTWSVVVRLTPYVRPVLVFVDSVARFGWQVDDDPEAAGPIQSMLADAWTSLRRFDRTDPAVPAHG